ncbi:zinc finger and BTB domain-containing protein 8A-like [Haliotis rubra]|uniref:zinc finger and BTB domain-containing protein 8A-like n=1 Tax=Haliotis rubra TaxID=36100 RepID=UPI001EE570B8|nr:zinc finger and BTB domain-containing protein 8A-like [Haliotis rubra]
METLREAEHGNTLRQRFEDLRNHQTLCDVTLVSNDGHKFQAHYLYLAVNSAYFQQELSLVRKDSLLPSTVFINIDAPASILSVLLDFIYTGELAVRKENIQEIENIAIKLKFKDAESLLFKSKYYSSITQRCSEDLGVLKENLSTDVFTSSVDTGWDSEDHDEQYGQESYTTDEELLQDTHQDWDALTSSDQKKKSLPIKSSPKKKNNKPEEYVDFMEDASPKTIKGRKKRTTSRTAKAAAAEVPKRKSARGSNAGIPSVLNSDVNKRSSARRSVRNLSKVVQGSTSEHLAAPRGHGLSDKGWLQN